MPRSQYRDAVDVIQATLRRWLSEAGFRVRGRAFNRRTDDGLTHVVSLQMGPFEPPGALPIPGLRHDLYGFFTINLGAYIPEVALYHVGGPVKSWIHEYNCAIRARLASVCGEQTDLWWRAEASPTVIDDVSKRLRIHGLPWLARFASRDDVLRELSDPSSDQWARPRRVVMAIIHVARGETQIAHSLLAAQTADAIETHPRHAQYVRELAMRLGVGELDV